jgi:hypothetical protein
MSSFQIADPYPHPPKKIVPVLRHFTPRVFIPALSKVQYLYFIIFLHSTYIGPYPLQILLLQSQSNIRPPKILKFEAITFRPHKYEAY